MCHENLEIGPRLRTRRKSDCVVCYYNFLCLDSGCTTVEALEGATLHPAQVLQIEHRKGTLNYDSDADLVFLDDDLNVHATFIAGEPVWLKKDGLVTGVMQLKYNMVANKVKKLC